MPKSGKIKKRRWRQGGGDTLPTAQVSSKPAVIKNEDKPKSNNIKKGNKSEIVKW